jgi:hypothetical protein
MLREVLTSMPSSCHTPIAKRSAIWPAS